MGLQEVDGTLIRPSKVEDGDHIAKARGDMDPRTFDKICRTIDSAIEEVVNKKATRLVWLNAGSLVGNRATMPHASHDHLWDAIYKLFPSSTNPVAIKNQRITVGSFIKWRVALRPENWLVAYRETDKVDIVTGRTVSASEYWISPQPVTVQVKEKAPTPKGPTVDDLKNRFNKRSQGR